MRMTHPIEREWRKLGTENSQNYNASLKGEICHERGAGYIIRGKEKGRY